MLYVSVQKDISKTNMIPAPQYTLGFFTIPTSSFVNLYVVFFLFSCQTNRYIHYGAWLLFQETSAWLLLLSGPTRNLNFKHSNTQQQQQQQAASSNIIMIIHSL
jgi:hypothetical protein